MSDYWHHSASLKQQFIRHPFAYRIIDLKKEIGMYVRRLFTASKMFGVSYSITKIITQNSITIILNFNLF